MIKLKSILLESQIDFQSMINDRNIQDSIKKFGIEKTEDYFDQIVKSVINTTVVYRLVTLPENVDPSKIQKLGQYWTDNYDTALDWINNWDHDEDKPIMCIFTANLSDKSIVNWPLTINHRFVYILSGDPDVTGGDEREIVLKENSRIHLIKLDCYDINTSKRVQSSNVNSFRQI